MNNILLELNSYTQKVCIFLDGKEISVYSELRNHTYKQIIAKPEGVIDTIGKELNDDFDLSVVAPQLIYTKIEQAAKENEYCNSCQPLSPKVSMSTKERYERLGENIEVKELTALLINCPIVPEPMSYGPVTVKLTAEQNIKADVELDFSSYNEITEELIADVCEIYLLNPLLGNIAGKSSNKEIFICSQISPVIEAVIPDYMEVGTTQKIEFTAYPEGSELPKIILQSSNPDVVAVEGHSLRVLTPGEIKISAFIAGENEPLIIQSVTASKTVLVTKIEIADIEEPIYVGKETELSINLYPADADDINTLTIVSSNPAIAEITENKLVIKSEGEFTVTAKTSKASYEKTYAVLPKLKGLSISAKKAEINVGGKMPIIVSLTPENAFNKEYSWVTSDKTVAIVVKEDNKEYIKAVGIGACEISCKSADGSITDTCSVEVKSIMYQKTKKKKKLPVIPLAGAVLAVAGFMVVKPTLAADPKDINVNNFIDYTEKYTEATPVDVFAGVEFIVEGNNDEGSISVQYVTEDDFIKNCSFEFSEKTGLSNGDTVVINVVASDTVIETFNCVPEESTKRIVVSGLAGYITSADEIPEEFLNEAIECLNEHLDWSNGGGFGISYSDSQHYATYFLTHTEEQHTWLAVVCYYDQFRDGVLEETEYVINWYENLAVDIDKNVSVSPETFDLSSSFSYDELDENLYFEDYITIKVE